MPCGCYRHEKKIPGIIREEGGIKSALPRIRAMVASCPLASDMCAHANLFEHQGKENPRHRINRILEGKGQGGRNEDEITLLKSGFHNLFSLIDTLDMLYGATLWRGFSLKGHSEWNEKLVDNLQSLGLHEENLLRTICMKISDLVAGAIIDKLTEVSRPEKEKKMLDSLMLAAHTIIAAELKGLGLRIQTL